MALFSLSERGLENALQTVCKLSGVRGFRVRSFQICISTPCDGLHSAVLLCQFAAQHGELRFSTYNHLFIISLYRRIECCNTLFLFFFFELISAILHMC